MATKQRVLLSVWGEGQCLCDVCHDLSAGRSGDSSEVDALREKAAAVQDTMAQNIERMDNRQAQLNQVEETSREGEGQGHIYIRWQV